MDPAGNGGVRMWVPSFVLEPVSGAKYQPRDSQSNRLLDGSSFPKPSKMTAEQLAQEITHLEKTRMSIQESDNPWQYSFAYNSFIESAKHITWDLGHTDLGDPLTMKLQDLAFTKNKEVRVAMHRFQEARKKNAARKRLSEYYEAESSAKFQMDVEMRGFIGLLHERFAELTSES